MQSRARLKICMLLPPLDINIRVNPQIEICSYLANFGHQVTWITSTGKDCPSRQFTLNGTNVYDISNRHYCPGDSPPAKIINLIPNIFRKMRFIMRLFREGEYNLIFVRNEPFDGLIASYLKRRFKIPFVYELSNPLEQTRGVFKIEPHKPKLLYYLVLRFNTWLTIRVMRKADLVLPTTRWFEDGLVKQGIPKSKLMPYPNGVNIELFRNKDGGNVCEQYHLSDSRTIIYVGIMGKGRCLKLLIQAFSEVRKRREDVKLLMVGDGNDRENLEKLADELEIRENVIFTGQVPQSEVPHFIAASDIGVSPVPPLSYFQVSSPIKIFEYMAMAKPVVANEEILEHKEVLEQSGGGLLVSYTAEALAEAIIKLLDNPEKAAETGRRGQDWVVKNRSYEVLARRLEDKYFELLTGELPAR